MNSGYFKTPNSIFDLDLSTNDKMVYIYLCRCANNSKAFPSYAGIAKHCSLSRSSAIRAVKHLTTSGLLTVNHNYYLSNLYTLNSTLPSVTQTPP